MKTFAHVRVSLHLKSIQDGNVTQERELLKLPKDVLEGG
jgi:hypothetical protein